MKKLTAMALFLFASLAASFDASAQEKHILLEQYTGAWCGWCVDGTLIMDKIIARHPGEVIGVKIHVSDSMAIQDQKVLRSAFGVYGVPAATINRRQFGGYFPQDRGSWQQITEALFLDPAKVEVNTSYHLDKETRRLKVKIYATMSRTVADSLKFNVIITEDSLSGVGNGWTQQNYLSHKSGYEDTPYYNLPLNIEGYRHVKVLRSFLCSPWGTAGSFETPALQGKTYVFEIDTIIPPDWNTDLLNIIGLVQADCAESKEVLNCSRAIKNELLMRLITSEEGIGTRKAGESIEKNFMLENLSDTTLTFSISTAISDDTPKDWHCWQNGADGGELTVLPGQSKPLKLTLTCGATRGTGIGIIRAAVKGLEDSPVSTGTVYCASADIKNMEIVSPGEAPASLTGALKQLGYNDFFTLTSDQYYYYAGLLTPSTQIWNCGIAGAFCNSDIDGMKRALDGRVPLFVCGNQWSRNILKSNYLPLFFSDYNGYFNHTYCRVWLEGDSTDPVSGNFGTNVEGLIADMPALFIKPVDEWRARPFLHFAKDVNRIIYDSEKKKYDTTLISGSDAIIGIRCRDKGRSVILSMHPVIIDNEPRRAEILDNIIKWIRYEIADIKEESIAAATVEVSPVPASNSVVLKFSPSSPEGEIRLYNSIGNSAGTFREDLSGGMARLNVAGLPPGVYTAVIIAPGSIQHCRFMVER